MKIFKAIERNMESGGFIRNQRAFNPTQLDHIAKAILCDISLIIYLVHESDTPRQYMESVLMTTVGIGVTTSYMSVVFNYDAVFELIDGIELDVNEREY